MVLMKVWQVGQPAHGLLPVVKGRVRSQSSAGVRVLYLQMLSQFPSTADPTCVLESLSHTDTGVRTQAVQTLEEWKEIPQDCIPSLLAMLKGPGREPIAAAQALKKVRAPNQDIISGLILALDNHDVHQQIAVIDCLGEHAASPDSVVPRLSALLTESSDSLVKLTIISTLGKYGVRARQALDALRQELRSADQTVSASARAVIDVITSSQKSSAEPPQH